MENGSSAHSLPPSNAGKRQAVDSKRTPGQVTPREGVRLHDSECAWSTRAEKHTCVLPQSMALST